MAKKLLESLTKRRGDTRRVLRWETRNIADNIFVLEDSIFKSLYIACQSVHRIIVPIR
jgi:hypothetical protein